MPKRPIKRIPETPRAATPTTVAKPPPKRIAEPPRTSMPTTVKPKATSTPEQVKWHNTPLAERMRILQSGKGIPSFIDPKSVKARTGWLDRTMGKQSMTDKRPKAPTSPLTPKTPTRRRKA